MSRRTHCGIIFGMILLTALISACEGPTGVPGKNAEGVDITPPTVVIDSPTPLTQEWDTLHIAVSAVDNVDIRQVTAEIDGSVYVGGQYLVSFTPPYQFKLDTVSVSRGWHYVSARAYDVAGNISDAPVIPIWFGYSDDLQDTSLMVHPHNDIWNSAQKLPNDERISSYWIKFRPARKCVLDTVKVMLSGNFSDSSEALVDVDIWQGSYYPADKINDGTQKIPCLTLGESPRWEWANFDSVALGDRLNYFIVVSLEGELPGDTLQVWTDNGMPAYYVSGTYDDIGWHYLEEQKGMPNNFLVSCYLYYAPTNP